LGALNHPMASTIRIIIAIALCTSAYLIGIYTGYYSAWPVPELKMLVRTQFDSDSVQTDKFGRLLRYPGKTEIPCPSQDATTAVLLVLGQSNAANSQGQRYQSADDRVVNFSEGHCYVASSPLLGADGRNGESWTLLGTKLVQSGLYSKVILIPAAVGSSPIHRWATGGDLNQMLLGVIRAAKVHYTITGVLWHQGAADFALHTPGETYRSGLESLIDTVHAEGVKAPFYISQSSLQLSPEWSVDNPISKAQAALVDGKFVFAGPNTDRDLKQIDRFDGLHFSASGQQKFTDAYVQLLATQREAEP
jgi:Carbohydrate esterase, sialic acid-specific acetylesterase